MDGDYDFDDQVSAVDHRFPSHAQSYASAYPGDLDAEAADAQAPIFIKPDWSIEEVHGHVWLDGSWGLRPAVAGALTRSTLVEALKLKARRRCRPPLPGTPKTSTVVVKERTPQQSQVSLEFSLVIGGWSLEK